jgi:hypothetical protein
MIHVIRICGANPLQQVMLEEIIEDMIENNEPIPEPQYETTKQD